MITVYLGTGAGADRVAAACAAHAVWLGRPLAERRTEAAGVTVYAAWDPATADDANRLLAVCENEADCSYADALADAAARIRVHLTLDEPRLVVAVPLAAPVQALHSRLPGGGRIFADDLRLMRRLLRPGLDPLGVVGLLKWGAAPAPLTILDGVERLVPGTETTWTGDGEVAETRDTWHLTAQSLAAAERPADAEAASALVVGAIDAALAAVPAGSAVHFSAGVDSPLIAARLAARGVEGIRLVHMEFADAPAETVAARAIADHLRLPIHVLPFDPGHGPAVLEHVGREAPFPVGDTSVIAGEQVLHAALDLGACGLVDGTAGGTADRRRRSWMRAAGLPSPVSAAAARLYRGLGLWHGGAGGRLAGVLRTASRAHGVPLPAASLAQNSLEGVAYDLPAAAARAIAAAIGTQARGLPGGPVGREAFAVSALVHQGSARWAAKVVGPATSRGLPAVLPFLAERVFAAKLLTLDGAWPGGASKPLLRMELLRHLPPELVNRPKHAFMSPMNAVLAEHRLRAAVEAAVERGRPLAGHVRAAPVRRLLAMVAAGRPIGDKQAGFLWTLAFADRWLADTEFGGG